MPARSTPKSKRSWSSSWLVPVVVLAVAAAGIAVVFSLNSGSGSAGASGTSTAGPDQAQANGQPDLRIVERRDASDVMAAGPADAPVAMVVFSDYQCQFCARFNAETLPLMMEYADAGDLRIEWRDVNVFGPASERAARASYAAGLQGAFWEYHNGLFKGGKHRSETDLSEQALNGLATELGLDADKFAADLGAEETARQIAANQKLGLELGAYSTPVIILGGQPIVGAQPSQVFHDAFQAALSAAK